MASTSSIGAQASASASTAQDFYSSYNFTLKDLKSQIDSTNQASQLESLVQQLSKARNELTEITSQLPTYDRQVHEQNLKEVSNLLTKKRQELKPNKAGFSFKRPFKTSTKASKVETETETEPQTLKTNPSNEPSQPLETSSFLSLSNKTGENLDLKSIERPQNGDEIVEASDLHLRNLTDCRIDLMDFSSRVRERDSERSLERKQEFKSQFKALQIRNLKNCLVYVGEVEGSVMIHGCERCVILVGCRQFRIHNSTSNLLLLKTASIITIENCHQLILTSIPTSLLPSTSENPQELQVQDFDHISDSEPSPNWKFLGNKEKEKVQTAVILSGEDQEGGSARENVERILGTAGVTL